MAGQNSQHTEELEQHAQAVLELIENRESTQNGISLSYRFDDLKQKVFEALRSNLQLENHIDELLTQQMDHIQAMVDEMMADQKKAADDKILQGVSDSVKDKLTGELLRLVQQQVNQLCTTGPIAEDLVRLSETATEEFIRQMDQSVGYSLHNTTGNLAAAFEGGSVDFQRMQQQAHNFQGQQHGHGGHYRRGGGWSDSRGYQGGGYGQGQYGRRRESEPGGQYGEQHGWQQHGEGHQGQVWRQQSSWEHRGSYPRQYEWQ